MRWVVTGPRIAATLSRMSRLPELEIGRGAEGLRKGGLEPPRPCGHQLLRLACLPFHHFRAAVRGSSVVPDQAARRVSVRTCPFVQNVKIFIDN